MARDFEQTTGAGNMSDEELEEVVRARFAEQDALDEDRIEVSVRDGRVSLSGRVGTEAELQGAERIITDVLGIQELDSQLVVDELVRHQQAEGADDEVAQRIQAKDMRGAGADATTDTASHLLPDTAGELYGTDSAAEAGERGYSYEPPDGPVQEGSRSRERH